MTDIIYDKGFDPIHISGKHDHKVKTNIIEKLSFQTAFINTTWLDKDEDLEKIIDCKPKSAVCYSSVDWENTICRKEPNDFIKKNIPNTIYVGNSNNSYYFSFWMDFVFEHLDKFKSFDNFNFDKNIKTFMCLNRKPHEHRIELVRKLFDHDLDKDGLISLGTFEKPVPWDYKGLKVPIKLPKDIVNVEGNDAVAGQAGGITNDITGLGYKKNWNSHFLHIVTETTVHTDVFISEKTFKPIIGMRPFIILGDDAIYQKIHEWGFDTFDDILGTGYKGKYYTDRINWILDVLKNLRKEHSLDKLLKKLEPRLLHNYKLFYSVAKKNRQIIQNLFQ